MANTTTLESIRVQGFRSLADIEITDLTAATILIGANVGRGQLDCIAIIL